MPESVSISVNGESRVPPGFRFHPTEEELLQYYLRKKVAYEKIDLDVIVEVDLNKLEPWDIQERCKIGSTPQNDWYFFSHKDKKYPTGTRTNRATMAGFWKATGRDKIIYGNGRRIGMRKTLVFYKGRAPHGQKSDWIMHEYRLDDNGTNMSTPNILPAAMGEAAAEEGWVVCRIFKKKNLHKSNLSRGPGGPLISATAINNLDDSPEFCYQPGGVFSPSCSSDDGSLEKMLGVKPAAGDSMKLPSLDHHYDQGNYHFAHGSETNGEVGAGGWAAIDRMLAAHLNGGQNPPDMGFSGDHHGGLGIPRTSSSSSSSGFYMQMAAQDYYSGEGEVDLWSLINRPATSPASDSLL